MFRRPEPAVLDTSEIQVMGGGIDSRGFDVGIGGQVQVRINVGRQLRCADLTSPGHCAEYIIGNIAPPVTVWKQVLNFLVRRKPPNTGTGVPDILKSGSGN